MSTRRRSHFFQPIGSTPDPADGTARFEVCLVESGRFGEAPVIYLTKYHGRDVGDRSVGMHPDVADDIAAMLRAAASMARDEQPT